MKRRRGDRRATRIAATRGRGGVLFSFAFNRLLAFALGLHANADGPYGYGEEDVDGAGEGGDGEGGERAWVGAVASDVSPSEDGVPVVVHRLGGDRADDGGLYAAVERGDAAALAHHLDELVGDGTSRGWRSARVPARVPARVAIVELGVLTRVEGHERVGGEQREERAARAGHRVEGRVGRFVRERGLRRAARVGEEVGPSRKGGSA